MKVPIPIRKEFPEGFMPPWRIQHEPHTLAQNCHCEFCCGVHLTCKNNPVTPDRNRRVFGVEWKENSFVATLKNGIESIEARKNSEIYTENRNGQEIHRSLRLRQLCRKIHEKSPSSVHVLNSKILMWFSLKNGMVVFGLATPHHDSKIAGTFAQQLGWVFVGPCHPSAHGPPAKLRSFTSLQMVHTHTFTLYTQDFLHTDAFTFTHKHPYTQTPLHRDTFTHRRLYPRQRLRSRFYTRTLLQTDAFAHRRFCTQRHLFHTDACTQMPFHTNTLDTQTLWHNKACTKNFPALLHTTQLADGARGGKRGARGGARRGCERWLREAPSTSTTFTSKLARSTSQYYFVPQSLQNVFSRTTYFVLQSLDKALPSTTLYACTKYFALQSLHKVLCTTKLAQSTSHFALQSRGK